MFASFEPKSIKSYRNTFIGVSLITLLLLPFLLWVLANIASVLPLPILGYLTITTQHDGARKYTGREFSAVDTGGDLMIRWYDHTTRKPHLVLVYKGMPTTVGLGTRVYKSPLIEIDGTATNTALCSKVIVSSSEHPTGPRRGGVTLLSTFKLSLDCNINQNRIVGTLRGIALRE